MFRYRIRTYIDITRTLFDRHISDDIIAGQMSNFNSFIQGIGLRANIVWDKDPTKHEDLWVWDFYVEQPEIFKDGEDDVALLCKDLHGIPIIGNLTNTRAIYPPVIRTLGQDLNTWIEIV